VDIPCYLSLAGKISEDSSLSRAGRRTIDFTGRNLLKMTTFGHKVAYFVNYSLQAARSEDLHFEYLRWYVERILFSQKKQILYRYFNDL